MSLARFWSSFKTLYFSKPATDRPIFREVKEAVQRGQALDTILEINVGDGVRSERLVQWIREQGAAGPTRYAAIDSFEMGGAGHIGLKAYHSMLGKLGVKPFPVPHTGTPAMSAESLRAALMRVAHTLGPVDLILLDCESQLWQEPTALQMLRRVTKPTTILLGKTNLEGAFERVSLPGEAVTERVMAA